jgi:predicted nucleic acid-binding protein
LASCTKQAERDLIEDLLKMSRHIPFEPGDWIVAADGGLSLARHGIRVPAFDLLTSAVAARTGTAILTLDSHYELIKTHAIAAIEIERILPDDVGK